MFGGITDGDRVAHLVALTNPDAQFQLIVQTRAWAESRLGSAGRQGLAFRTTDIGAGRTHGGRTTVIADRHVLVVRRQRIVRAEQFADVLRVLDADVEVGVIADARRQMHLAIGGQWQQFRALSFDVAALGAGFAEQFQQTFAQGNPRLATEVEEGIQLAATGGFHSTASGAVEQTCFKGNLQIEEGGHQWPHRCAVLNR